MLPWFSVLILVTAPNLIQGSSYWTQLVSEEGGSPPATCDNGFAVGIRCSGRYCDNVALKCFTTDGTKLEGSQWMRYISEEDTNLNCPTNYFITGIRCSGRYCDNISFQCSTSNPQPVASECYWSAPVSEENGGTFETGLGQYINGIQCFGKYCDEMKLYVCSTKQTPLVCNSAECEKCLAEKFAPYLRFDQTQGSPNKCFPSDAGEYFAARKAGDHGRICETNYQKLENGQIPTYYDFKSCGGDTAVISYWFFIAWQDYCSPGLGEHDADWEHVVVKIEKGQLTRVAYYQHNGHYTRTLGQFELNDGQHPVVYSGKNSHGSYHDDGGTGSCLYFEDYRNPGSADKKLRTWLNLVRLSKDPSAPEWMRSTEDQYFDGNKSPLRRDINLCNLTGCQGKDFFSLFGVCVRNCGCKKSSIGDSPF